MKYQSLIDMLGKEGFFDLATVVQLTGERRESIRMQLHRWCKSGKLVHLRRGMYAFPKTGGLVSINPAKLANSLYSPSYISTYWALGFYGLIPERVVAFTSVTSRVSRSFNNSFGYFRYHSIKKGAFFGYRSHDMNSSKVILAEPEKALLDLWYFETGNWTEDRMNEMRFQNTESITGKKLLDYAKAFGSPRLLKIAGLWQAMVSIQDEGTRQL